MTIMTTKTSSGIAHMPSLLDFFSNVSKVLLIRKSKQTTLRHIFPYLYFCPTVYRIHWYSSIPWRSNIRPLPRLNVVTSNCHMILYEHFPEAASR